MSDTLIKEDWKLYDNKSLIFFLPMLGEYLQEFSNLRGVFIKAEEFPNLNNHIFLLFVNSNSVEFKENLSRLKTFANFYKSYKPDNFHTMLIFIPPTELQKDYQLLKESKYSKISESYKKQIFKFHNIRNGISPKISKFYKDLIGVLYKKDELRESLMERLGIYIPEEQELASELRLEKSEKYPDFPVETYLDEMKVLTNINNQQLLS